MSELYEPKSDFLKSVAADEVPLTGKQFGEANLSLLIKMTSDGDPSNRDWATLLLGQTEIDTPVIRDVFLRIAGDAEEENHIRAEAIYALAKRDSSLALPFVQEALSSSQIVWQTILDAAELCAHQSLVASLRRWVETSDDDEQFNSYLGRALRACEAATY